MEIKHVQIYHPACQKIALRFVPHHAQCFLAQWISWFGGSFGPVACPLQP